MSGVCQIKFRSIRLGSLRTYQYPSKKQSKDNSLLFTDTKLSFNAVLCKTEGDVLRMHIPCSGITLIEWDMAKCCPHIWITTDSATAEQVRVAANMHQDLVRPTPYFDPQSKQLADRRICVIPFHDPMKEDEHSSFISVVEAIAKDRNVQKDDIFKILESDDSRSQLIECTKYILNLKEFRYKPLYKPATYSKSPKLLDMFDESDSSSCEIAGTEVSYRKRPHSYDLRSSTAYTKDTYQLNSSGKYSITDIAQHSETDSPVLKCKTKADDREASPIL